MIKTIQDYKIHPLGALHLLPEIKDKSADLVLTDIPYGEVNRESNGLRNLDKGIADNVNFDLIELLDEFLRICKGSMYIFCGTKQVSLIRNYLKTNGLSTRLCIWEKNNPSPMNGEHIWLSGIECCVYGKFPNATFNEHCENTVFRYNVVKNQIHPTEKPLKLFERLILASTNKGDMVVDSFVGSGTTLEACLKTERNCMCFDISNEWEHHYKKRLMSDNSKLTDAWECYTPAT